MERGKICQRGSERYAGLKTNNESEEIYGKKKPENRQIYETEDGKNVRVCSDGRFYEPGAGYSEIEAEKFIFDSGHDTPAIRDYLGKRVINTIFDCFMEDSFSENDREIIKIAVRDGVLDGLLDIGFSRLI